MGKILIRKTIIYTALFFLLNSCESVSFNKVNDLIKREDKNLIIYSEPFQESAELFRDLHAKYENVESKIITVEEINKKSALSEEPKFAGYSNNKPTGITISGYDYSLARKIIAYIGEKYKNNEISSVLLIGDAEIIPPSYYFYNEDFPDSANASDSTDFNRWIASDFFYGSPNLDLYYDLPVGRISVDTPKEALITVNKLIKWRTNAQEDIGSYKTIYVGGNVTYDYRYLGEMFYLMLQKSKILGNDVLFHLESQKQFTKENLQNVFEKENASMMFIYSHGEGDGFVLKDGEELRSQDIEDLQFKPGLPLVVSPSCMDGGFDGDLIKNPFKVEPTISVGEAIIRSPGAGIGYLGSVRSSVNKLDFEIKDGQVNTLRAGLMSDLILKFLNSYYNLGKYRIGDALVDAYRTFYNQEKLEGKYTFFTYANLVFLGDPVLTLAQPQKYKNDSFAGMDFLDEHTIDRDGFINFPASTYMINLKTMNNYVKNSVKITVINTTNLETLISRYELKPKGLFQLQLQGSGLYLVSSESGNKVIWQYFKVA